MKNTSLHRLIRFILIFTILVTGHRNIYAQDCTVDMAQLKGTYTGECKKGKAHGEGKAVGTDIYEGPFKSGVPDGKGLYTWSNGNTFKGSFAKGLKNGEGVMTYKIEGKWDSIVEGFWKKDLYIGRYEYPYKVFSKTKKVTKVDIKSATSAIQGQITIWVSSTMSSVGITGPGVNKVEITNLILQTGSYIRTAQNNSYTSKSETTLYDVTFPIRMRLDFSVRESVEVLINEQGSYIIDITINQ